MSKKPIGIILWSGKSLIDGERIAVIATGVFSKSENKKTGDSAEKLGIFLTPPTK